MHSRSVVNPYPDVALQDQSGSLLRISVGKLDRPGCEALRHQLPSTVEVTAAASGFMENGTLPGTWGKRFQLGPWHFG
jgi:hypothetical protein